MKIRYSKILSFFIAMLILITQNTWISYGSTNDLIKIYDKNLENKIRTVIGKPNGNITQGDMESITSLNLIETNVSNLDGIQYAKHLNELIAPNCGINDISYLSKLNELMEVDLSNNNISDISDLSGAIHLSSVNLNNNYITSISALADKLELRNLTLDNNRITDISPLVSNVNIAVLTLNNNSISDISVLEKVVNLTDLRITKNSISDISPIITLKKLTSLFLSDNNISDILPITNLVHLKELYLSNNNITSIKPISQLTKLEYLYLANNTISDISSLSHLNKLIEINLAYNSISDISALSGIVNPSLNYVNLNGNALNNIRALSGISMSAQVLFEGYWTVKYLDENNHLIEPETNYNKSIANMYTGVMDRTFNSREEIKEVAKNFTGYVLNDVVSKNIVLDNSKLNDEIEFHYIKESGSITIKYQDENNVDIDTSTVIKDLALGTYLEEYKEVPGYIIDDVTRKSVTLTELDKDQVIVFKYKEVKGVLTIRYQDYTTGVDIAPSTFRINLRLGIYIENASNLTGYTLVDIPSRQVNLTTTNNNQTIIFKYNKNTVLPESPPIIPPTQVIKGKYQVRYIDELGNLLEPITNYTNLDLGTYTEQAKSFSGYYINDDTNKFVTLTKDKLEQIIEFKYKKITGTVQGTVTDNNGAPIQGVRVELHSNLRYTLTDKNGFYKFTDVELGEHVVKILDVNYKAIREIRITVSADESDKNSTKTVDNISEAFQNLVLNQVKNNKIVDFVVVPITQLPQTGDKITRGFTPMMFILSLCLPIILYRRRL